MNAVHDVGAREDDNDAFASSDVVRSSEFMAALHLQTMDSSKLLIKGLVVGERGENFNLNLRLRYPVSTEIPRGSISLTRGTLSGTNLRGFGALSERHPSIANPSTSQHRPTSHWCTKGPQWQKQ